MIAIRWFLRQSWILLVLGMCFCWCPSAFATYNIVGHACAQGNNTTVTTPAINTTGANYVILALSTSNSPMEITAPTDTAGNWWNTYWGGALNSGYGSVQPAGPTTGYNISRISVWGLLDPDTSTTYQVTYSGAPGWPDYPSLCVLAIAGVHSQFPIVSLSGGNTDTDGNLPLGMVRTNHTDALIVSAVAGTNPYGAGDPPIPPMGFTTLDAPLGAISSTASGIGMGYKIDSSLMSQDVNWTVNIRANVFVIFRSDDSINRIGHGDPDIMASSSELSDVNAALMMAQCGDIVGVPPTPAGTRSVWSGQVYMPGCGVEIRGAGMQPGLPPGSPHQTRILIGPRFSTSSCMICGSVYRNYPMMIDGLDILGNADTLPSANSTMDIISYNRSGGDGLPWQIHHNDFVVEGLPTPGGPQSNNGIRSILASGRNGIVYKNRFIATPPAGQATNNNSQALNNSVTDFGAAEQNNPRLLWQTPSSFGQLDAGGLTNLYVEDNYFEGFNVMMDSNNRGRAVFRFNDIHSATMTGHGNDSGWPGVRQDEFYGNKMTCDTPNGGGLDIGFWWFSRGGTHRVFGNTFPSSFGTPCNLTGQGNNTRLAIYAYRAAQCHEIPGWPGQYSSTYGGAYPIGQQVGWGWDSARNIPSFDGPQAIEPSYFFQNTNDATVNGYYGYVGACRAMATSNWATASATSFTLNVWNMATAGQPVLAIMADNNLQGTPEITSDGCSTMQNWQPISGGTNGSIHIRGWWAVMTETCGLSVTVSWTGASTAARAGAVIVLRGINNSVTPLNPPTMNIGANTTNQYHSPMVSPGSQALIVSYYAMNTQSQFLGGNGDDWFNDQIAVYNPVGGSYGNKGYYGVANVDLATVAGCWACGNTDANPPRYPGQYTGFAATSTLPAGENIFLGTTYRASDAGNISPFLTNLTSQPAAIAGTISFTVGTNVGTELGCSGIAGGSCLDLQSRDFILRGREYFEQQNNGGIQAGPRNMRPMPCGAPWSAWWATDVGTWNHNTDQTKYTGQGALDVCKADGTWADAYYIPYPYPNPLTDDTPLDGGPRLTWTQPPTNVIVPTVGTQVAFNPPVVVTITPAVANQQLMISVNTGNCGIANPTAMTNSSGVATFSALTVTAPFTLPQTCTFQMSNTTDPTVPSIISGAISVTDGVPPPPMPVLSFFTQPTTTQMGMTMSPVVVHVTPNTTTGNVTLMISNCGASAANLTAALSSGAATFSMLAMSGQGFNCTFTASLMGATGDTSNTFDVTLPAPPVGTISIGNGGNGYGCRGSATGNSIDGPNALSQQANSGGFNAAGSDGILAIVTRGPEYGSIGPSHGGVTDNQGNTYTPIFSPFAGTGDAMVMTSQMFFAPNPVQGYTIFNVSPTAVVGLQWPSICVILLSGTNGQPPMWMAGNYSNSANSIGLASPLAINQGAFVVSALGSNVDVSQGPSGYSSPIGVPYNSPTNYATDMAWKEGNLTTENPTWTAVGSGVLINNIVGWPSGLPANPTLSIVQGPFTTTSGQAMSQVIVHSSDLTSTALVTLSINGACSSISATGNTANLSNGSASFNMLVPLGIGTGCTITASAPGHISASPPTTFDILPSGVGLFFTQQPTNTVQGGAFNPPVAGRRQ